MGAKGVIVESWGTHVKHELKLTEHDMGLMEVPGPWGSVVGIYKFAYNKLGSTHGQNLLSVTSCAPLLLPAYNLLPFYSMINLTWYVSLSALSLHPPRPHTVFFPACFTTSELYSSDHLHSPSSSTPTDPLSVRQFSTNLFITFPPPTYGINCLQGSWASNDCFSNVEQITITKIYRA